MKRRKIPVVPALLVMLIWTIFCTAGDSFALDPLPSWRGGAGSPKSTIIAFIERVTDPSGTDFIPIPLRIAVFDMDGTILCERPLYLSLEVALHRLALTAKEHPELRDQPLYQAVTKRDLSYIRAHYLDILLTAFKGYTQKRYMEEVQAFLKNSRHPRFDRPYAELVYQPVRELVEYLQGKEFRVYLVSGSWHAFVRSVAANQLVLESYQAIGSKAELDFLIRDGTAFFIRKPEQRIPPNLREGKPINMWDHIGEIPILAMGNSRADQEMLEYTDTNPLAHIILCLEHDDAEREFQYPSTLIYKESWIPVSMQKDFAVVFPPKK